MKLATRVLSKVREGVSTSMKDFEKSFPNFVKVLKSIASDNGSSQMFDKVDFSFDDTSDLKKAERFASTLKTDTDRLYAAESDLKGLDQDDEDEVKILIWHKKHKNDLGYSEFRYTMETIISEVV